MAQSSFTLAAALMMSLVMIPAASGATPSNSTSTNPFDPAFAKFANDILKQWNVPGISLAVVDGENIYSQVSCYHILSWQSLTDALRATASLLCPTLQSLPTRSFTPVQRQRHLRLLL